jgi:hypothetical protein
MPSLEAATRLDHILMGDGEAEEDKDSHTVACEEL